MGHSCCGGIHALMGMQDEEEDSRRCIRSWVIVGKNARISTKSVASNLSFDQQCRHCEKIIEAFQKCHADHPFGKIFGKCTELKIKLDGCFRKEVDARASYSLSLGVSYPELLVLDDKKYSIIYRTLALENSVKTKKQWRLCLP
ncbi:uncharacterized protein LOC125491596 isoform X2 [Beta vulgaris subsp. vulgaris]|nr:uncharacterized protein LOC125491596 isoform X2 [Beta vulgaris subsp. vulgaris]